MFFAVTPLFPYAKEEGVITHRIISPSPQLMEYTHFAIGACQLSWMDCQLSRLVIASEDSPRVTPCVLQPYILSTFLNPYL